jgi:beta-1,4-N-acetylglucosaminyltransferase
MQVFITVGTTNFINLIQLIVESKKLHLFLMSHGYHQLILQAGKLGWDWISEWTRLHSIPFTWSETQQLMFNLVSGLDLIVYDYAPTLIPHMEKSSLIITHAGAGCVLEALRTPLVEEAPFPGRKIVVVTNPALQDNHQIELATELHLRNYVVSCTPMYVNWTLARSFSVIMYPNLLDRFATSIFDRDLLEAVQAVHAVQLAPFPAQDPDRFRKLLLDTLLLPS